MTAQISRLALLIKNKTVMNNQDIYEGKVVRKDGVLCFLSNGYRLKPMDRSHYLCSAVLDTEGKKQQVNCIEAATIDQIEEADVDTAKKRRYEPIEQDNCGIPIVKKARVQTDQLITTPMTNEPITKDEPMKGTKNKPAYCIRSAIEEPPLLVHIQEAMEQATISMPVYRFLGMSKEGHHFMHSIITRKCLANTDVAETHDNRVIVEPTVETANYQMSRSKDLYSIKAV
ncbi:hypothetical protein H4219_004874 [Mycoemilia scoparia]|uniref:Uncharacterized protein n=1 Tax=Mycoemilia scoparia TaxID=417184 RepID=A0A9W7ZZR9_9FUNG|nr:hypothetical protein H4219_004874 [Mycoemilia scoparia]